MIGYIKTPPIPKGMKRRPKFFVLRKDESKKFYASGHNNWYILNLDDGAYQKTDPVNESDCCAPMEFLCGDTTKFHEIAEKIIQEEKTQVQTNDHN